MDYLGKYFELCVLIPCYNNLQGLKKSLDSIRYDREKYLILVTDDGSNEPIQEESLLQNNGDAIPVQIIRLPENKGIAVALNTGLQWIIDNIKCTYIARLDCGDICDEQRFYKQINYLRVNTEVYLLGSWCYFQNKEKKIRYSYKTPRHHKQIKRSLYFRNLFIHPTVVFRYDILKKVGLYPESYPHAEDYAWFWKIANHEKTAIIPLYLVVCELNLKGISYSNRIKQLQTRLVIVREFGRNFALRQMGVFKIRVLMKIPYAFVLHVKKLFTF